MYNHDVMNDIYRNSFDDELQKLASGGAGATALALLALGGLGGLFGMGEASSVQDSGSIEAAEMPFNMYLNQNQLETLQSAVDSAKRDDGKFKSFSLRHPFITGAATLGIAPSIAAADIRGPAMTAIKRNDPAFAEAYRQALNEEIATESAAIAARSQQSRATNDSLRLIREMKNS